MLKEYFCSGLAVNIVSFLVHWNSIVSFKDIVFVRAPQQFRDFIESNCKTKTKCTLNRVKTNLILNWLNYPLSSSVSLTQFGNSYHSSECCGVGLLLISSQTILLQSTWGKRNNEPSRELHIAGVQSLTHCLMSLLHFCSLPLYGWSFIFAQ